MNELLELDKQLFFFINQSLSNPATDFLMPIVTSFQYWLPLYIIGIIYLLLRFRMKGIFILVVLFFTVGLCDLLNAQLLKEYFVRVRPCSALEDVNLLINCGAGHSFPSNHAVNNFAAATILSYYFQRKIIVLFSLASLVATSRIFVGVHYPIDILIGSLVGIIIGTILLLIVKQFDYNSEVREKIRIN